MNAGRDFQAAFERAQAIANAVCAPRWLHYRNGFWWINENPGANARRVDPE